MIQLVTFDFRAELTASDLDTMDANIAEGVWDVGRLRSYIQGESWVVIPLGYSVSSVIKLEMDRVMAYDLSTRTFYNYTNAVRQAAQNPIMPHTWSLATGDIIYFGSPEKFDTIFFEFRTASGGGASLTWYYWDGSTWSSLSIDNDTTTNWTGDGLVDWTAPADWEKSYLDLIKTGGRTGENIDPNFYGYFVYVVQGNSPGATIDEVTKGLGDSISPTGYPDLQVKAQDTPDMSVRVLPGVALVDSKFVVNPSEVTIDIESPAASGSNKWNAAVLISRDGELYVSYSTAAVTPDKVHVPADSMKIAEIEVSSGATQVTNANITDQRSFTTWT